MAVPDAIRQLEARDGEIITRQHVQTLFRASRSRSAALMRGFGAELVGGALGRSARRPSATPPPGSRTVRRSGEWSVVDRWRSRRCSGRGLPA